MLDFGMLPPEIISAKMYTGPGSGPMMAAAASWDGLAGQLNSFALGYTSVISELHDEGWSGAASEAMAAAAQPYITWATTTAALTEQVAGQARAAAGAYEIALAATVPPTTVTANRQQLATLVANNLFGQNTTLIAATEAAYAQMWAQDAAAMHGYATAASSATQLTPFHEPPQTTDVAAQFAQSAAPAQAVAAAPAQAVSAAPLDPPPSLEDTVLNGVGGFNTLAGPGSFGMQIGRTFGNSGSFFLALSKALGGSAPKVAAAPAVSLASTAGATGPAATLARQAVAANLGSATPVGQLSVPRAWAEATPVAAAAEEPLWLSEVELASASSWEELPESGMVGAAPVAGMGPMTGTMGRSSVSNTLRVGPRRFTMPRPAFGG